MAKKVLKNDALRQIETFKRVLEHGTKRTNLPDTLLPSLTRSDPPLVKWLPAKGRNGALSWTRSVSNNGKIEIDTGYDMMMQTMNSLKDSLSLSQKDLY